MLGCRQGGASRGVLGVVVVLAACEVPPTQLVVVVRTDMAIPEELDAFAVRVTGPGSLEERGPFELTGSPPAVLPATFGVRPEGGDAERLATMGLTARRDGVDLFATRAATSVLDERKLQLDVFLAERCIEEALGCVEPGQTCTENGCDDEWRDPSGLPEWQGLPDRDAGAPDAGPRCGEGVEPGQWAAVLASGESIMGGDITVDPAGNTHVVGTFRGSVSFQGLAAVTADGTDGFWVCFDPVGCPCWDAPRVFGGAEGDADAPQIAAAPGGEMVLAAQVTAGQLVFSGQSFGDAGVVARFDVAGELIEGVSVAASRGWIPGSVIVTSSGGTLVSGLALGSPIVAGNAAGVDVAAEVPPTATAIATAILWEPDLSDPRIGTVSSSVDIAMFFAAEAPDGTIVTTGTLADGVLSINGIVADLSGTARSFVAAFGPADMQVRWGGPLVGGSALSPRVLPVGSSVDPLIFAASVFPPLAELADESIDVPLDHASDTVVAGLTADGAPSPLELLGTESVFGLTDACSAGGGAVLVGARTDGEGFAVGLDGDRQIVRVEDLSGTAALVAASPAGDVVAILGILAGPAEIGGHPVGQGMYVYSLDPDRDP